MASAANKREGLEIVPGEQPNWLESYAGKSIQCDQLISIIAAEAETRKKLYQLYARWVDDSNNHGCFMPEEGGDKIARTRTGACAEQLRKILHGEEK